MLDVEQNLLLLSVVSDEGVQRVAVGHPSNQARVGGQRDHCVALDAVKGSNKEIWDFSATVSSRSLNDIEWLVLMGVPEVLAQGRGVVGEQRVNQAEQLHDSLVLPQVLVALQQEHELVAVAACRGRQKHISLNSMRTKLILYNTKRNINPKGTG